MKERAYTLNTSGRSGTKRRYLNEGKSGMAAADGQTCRPAAPPSARPSAEATGLSKSQNRTHGGSCIPKRRRVTVYHGAGLLEVESRPRGDAANCSQERRRPRGKIHSWSAKSRMRCRKLLQSLDREALTNSWFVTTTYPAVFPAPDDQAIYKGHLHRLTQEIRRRHPDVSGVWKLEFQKREAAHFHFLLIGCSEDIYSFRNWIAQTWARIVNSGDPNHERVGTGVDRIRTYGGVMAYVTSYISKDDQTLPGNFTGRYWGIINREHLPRIAPTEYDVSDAAAVQINRWRRTLSRKYQEHSRWNKWASLLVKLPGNYNWMSRTEYEYAWSQRTSKPHPHFFDVQMSKGTFPVPWTALRPEMSNGSKLRPPRRVRQWNNTGGTLLCNASTFWAAVERGIQRGIIA